MQCHVYAQSVRLLVVKALLIRSVWSLPPCPPSPGAGGRGAGGVGGRGGGSPARAAGGAGRLVSGRASLPENLIAVGRLVGNIEYVQASGGISLNVDVETRLTDLYKISPWWLELPDVEDVMKKTELHIIAIRLPSIVGDKTSSASLLGVYEMSAHQISLFQIFQRMLQARAEGLVVSCAVSSTTLEDAFNKICRDKSVESAY